MLYLNKTRNSFFFISYEYFRLSTSDVLFFFIFIQFHAVFLLIFYAVLFIFYADFCRLAMRNLEIACQLLKLQPCRLFSVFAFLFFSLSILVSLINFHIQLFAVFFRRMFALDLFVPILFCVRNIYTDLTRVACANEFP